MNIAVDTAHPHLNDAELVRLLDSELSDWEAIELRKHLSACASCAGRRDSLYAAQEQVSATLRGIEIPRLSPERIARSLAAVERAAAARLKQRFYARSAALRAAAGIVLLFATAMAVTPVRAWIVEQWDSLVAAPAAELPPGVAAGSLEPSVVSFVPSKEVFRIHLAHPQQSGGLVLAARPVERAAAEVLKGSSAEAFTVLPDGLLIANSPASTTGYLVTVPESVEWVELLIGDGPLLRIPMAERELPWVRHINLGKTGEGEFGVELRSR